jgi:hypothetical protein
MLRQFRVSQVELEKVLGELATGSARKKAIAAVAKLLAKLQELQENAADETTDDEGGSQAAAPGTAAAASPPTNNAAQNGAGHPQQQPAPDAAQTMAYEEEDDADSQESPVLQPKSTPGAVSPVEAARAQGVFVWSRAARVRMYPGRYIDTQ